MTGKTAERHGKPECMTGKAPERQDKPECMTLEAAYEKGESLLRDAGIDNPRLDAWYLLEHVSGADKAAYYARPDVMLTKDRERQYMSLVKRRSKRVPLQHLTGVQEFMGLEFLVSEQVLIPRQDTEVLVEAAMRTAREFGRQMDGSIFKILDLCTGSGCVLLSLLHHVRKLELPPVCVSCQGLGTDISQNAIDMALLNARRLNIGADFMCSDLFAQVRGTYQMITANPPYIKTKDIESLQEEVKKHDPLLALDGKEDGLFFYRKITAQAGKYLVRGGFLLFEIGAGQGKAVCALMQEAGFSKVVVQKDLAGLDRVVIGVYDKK